MAFVQAFDHFVVPVDDLVAAEDFYPRVFGGAIVGRMGLNVQHRQRGAVPHTFIRVAGKRIGVYLQSEERPESAGVRGAPTYSFETTPEGLRQTRAELTTFGTPCEGPLQNDRPLARGSLYFNDLAGNHFHVYIPSPSHSAGRTAPRAAMGDRMVAVGYLQLEAPDLAASVQFYTHALGLELLGYGEDDRQEARQATLRLPSGPLLHLSEVPFSPKGLVLSRTVPGPHLGFYVPAHDWEAALANLDRLGIPHGDRGAAKTRRSGEGGTYMDDPAGNVVQFITDGME